MGDSIQPEETGMLVAINDDATVEIMNAKNDSEPVQQDCYFASSGIFQLLAFIAIIAGVVSPVSASSTSIAFPAIYSDTPVVLTGAQLPVFVGFTSKEIGVFAYVEEKLQKVVFQIDQKDAQGRFEHLGSTEKQRQAILDANDELVFMASALGQRRPAGVDAVDLHEVEITDLSGSSKGWIYIDTIAKEAAPNLDNQLVKYNDAEDSIETSNYRMVFSPKRPFLADSLQWSTGSEGEYGENIISAMRIIHAGKFLFALNFYRTEEDYSSKLIAVKEGPVRVIRRTENRVHIAFGIGSPKIWVDYIIYPANFVMDIIIDLPFRIGLIFSRVTTTALMMLADGLSPQDTSLRSRVPDTGMSLEEMLQLKKNQFHGMQDIALLLDGSFGQMVARVEMEAGSPIKTVSGAMIDPSKRKLPGGSSAPPGVGFHMTDWEKLNSQVHHILFNSYLLRGTEKEDAFGRLGK